MKRVALVATPEGHFTRTRPVGVPVPTTKVICVGELMTKERANLPPTVTTVTVVRFVPWMTTLVPEFPVGGLNDVIVGAPRTVNVPELVAIPAGPWTVIGPD